MSLEKKRICILGAGPAGLACLKHFTEKLDKFDVTCYEKGSQIGGQWIYTEDTGNDIYGEPIHSSIYKHMTTNIPKEFMEYPNFPHEEHLPSFFAHEEVLKYLKRYAVQFKIEQYIQFNMKVTMVRPVYEDGGLWGTKWKVQVQPLAGSKLPPAISEFDAVIICTGLYSDPNIPDYPGISEFRGPILHGHSYRVPTVYKDQTVLTIGGSISGWDITQEIANYAKHVYLSHYREILYTLFPGNVELTTGVARFTRDGVILTDGRELKVDAVILNTGYRHSFPFLSQNCEVRVTNATIRPLYKQTICITQPTLSIVSVIRWSFIFRFLDCQAQFVLAVLEERIKLPCVEDMLNCEEAELQKRLDVGWPANHLHYMKEFMFDSYDDLARSLNIDVLPRWCQPYWKQFIELMLKTSKSDMKNMQFKIIEPDEIEVICTTNEK